MNLKDFVEAHKHLKNADTVTVRCDNGEKCVNPLQPNIPISKAAAIKNLRKHGGERFICRKCDMKYANPMTKVGKGKRSASKLTQEIDVVCPTCPPDKAVRKMKVSSYTGSLDSAPYIQVCGSCSQHGKTIPAEQKAKISETLTGIKRSDEFKQKLREHMTSTPEGIERAKKNLVPGIGSGWNQGKMTPPETRQKISAALKGKVVSAETRQRMSAARKGKSVSPETRQKLSAALKGKKRKENPFRDIYLDVGLADDLDPDTLQWAIDELRKKKAREGLTVEENQFFTSLRRRWKTMLTRH